MHDHDRHKEAFRFGRFGYLYLTDMLHTVSDRAGCEYKSKRPTSPRKAKHRDAKLSPHLSHHAVPRAIDLLAMFAIRHQVKVVGELDRLGDLLQDVNAETLTAALYVDPGLLCLITA